MALENWRNFFLLRCGHPVRRMCVCGCASDAGAGQPACGAQYNDLAKHARRTIQQAKRSYQRC